MAIESDDLLNSLQALTADVSPARWLVAFSGGIDSTVLLHALANSNTTHKIVAIHIDHGLQRESAEWEVQCRAFAAALGVDFVSQKVSVAGNAEKGPEAAARQARYAALMNFVQKDDCLLSAHHEDDQAETLLLNLMRGSGPAGLAGIGAKQSFGRGFLLRPLLGIPGEEISAYAEHHGLSWIDDPSNVDTRFDRNFLRKKVMPVLAARWPAVANRLRRSAELVSEASELLNELADIDLERCGRPMRLNIGELRQLTSRRQRNVIRRATRLCGLPPPPATRLYQVIHELIPARPDAQPLVGWPGVELRRYRDHLFVMPALDAVLATPAALLRANDQALQLGPGLGSIALADSAATGLDRSLAEAGLSIRYRTGGEEIRIAGNGATRKLKKLMQEEGVLPWMRGRLPLLFARDALVAVGDLWVSADHLAEPGMDVRWHDKPEITL